MNKEISEKMIGFMNMAEKRYNEPALKQDFVIRRVLYLYPNMHVEDIKNLIGILITVSKLTTKILFNATSGCCSIS